MRFNRDKIQTTPCQRERTSSGITRPLKNSLRRNGTGESRRSEKTFARRPDRPLSPAEDMCVEVVTCHIRDRWVYDDIFAILRRQHATVCHRCRNGGADGSGPCLTAVMKERRSGASGLYIVWGCAVQYITVDPPNSTPRSPQPCPTMTPTRDDVISDQLPSAADPNCDQNDSWGLA
jgi:hypothetical protein